MKQAMVDIYYASVCGLCAKTLEYFRSRGLDFHARAVVWDKDADAFRDDDNARELFRRCGGVVDFVPQIFVNDTRIAGWRSLEPMIADGSFDRLLQETN